MAARNTRRIARDGTPGRMPERRGATLILIALLIVVLVGMVGVVLDFGRFYAYRVEMQTTADAAALAGAQELVRNSPSTAPDSALDYVPVNVVDGGSAFVPRDSVLPGIWSFSSSTFTQQASFTSPGVNAVKVDVSHSAVYTFGRVWQTANINLHTTSTAALGFVQTTDCLKPWAVSYQTLLDALYPPAGSKPVSYNLTTGDIKTLSQEGPANQLPLILSDNTQLTPGNIQSVIVNNPWSGNNSYKAAIDGSCPDLQIGPGTWLAGDPGAGGGRTASALKTFCDANGGTTGGANNFTCLGSPKVKMAMWDINNGQPGANLQVRVKYVGVFAVTSFVKHGTSEQISGYFSSMASTGSVGSTPTPIAEGLLVQ